MKKIAIMQPGYFPWSGYLNLIAQSDVFVFLDDVQFTKEAWHNRNRVLLNGKAHWISVPVHRENVTQLIYTIQIDDHARWREKQFKLLQQTYAKHPYTHDMLDLVSIILDSSITHLTELNLRILNEICCKAGIETELVRSKDLNISADRSERLIQICKYFKCDEYVSPPGAKDYLTEDGKFEHSGIQLKFQNFIPQPYPQLNSEQFVSHLSIIDVLANLGWKDTLDYIKQGQLQTSERGI